MEEELEVYKKETELARIGVWEFDAVTGKLSWDVIIRQILEVDENYEPTIESAIALFIDKEHQNKVRLLAEECFATGEPGADEIKVITAQHNLKWAIVYFRTEFCDGNLRRAYGTLQDITLSKSLMERLTDSEARFHHAFEFAPIGMALVCPQLGWIRINQSLCSMLDYTAPELMKISLQEITHPSDLETDLENFKKLLSHETESYAAEKRYLGKNGKVIWGYLNVTLVANRPDSPPYFIFQIRDITRHKESINQLIRERLHLEHIIQSTDSGVWEWEIWGDHLSLNEQCIEMLGYAADEFKIDKMDDWRAIIHQEDLDACDRSMLYCLHHKTAHLSIEFRARHKKGHWIWIDAMGKIVEWTADGTPITMIGTHKNISARKQTEQERKKNLEIINDQNKRLINFAHIVSHNLRSHASNMQMMVDLLADEENEEEKTAIMKLLRQNAVNLKETVANLNDVVKTHDGIEEDKKSLCLATETRKALLNVNCNLTKIGAEVLIDINEGLFIRHLPAYLESILLNMLTNAIKYRDPQRPLCITITAEEIEEMVLLRIADNGLGIDLNLHGSKLFGMYKTFHTHEEARGIGLYITRNQIEAMGGHIELESEVGKGTTFSIYFKK
jgi:PAS domain S-box-containing protein